MSFVDALAALPLDELTDVAANATPDDVERALRVERRDLHHFAALLSPAAGARLEDLAAQSHRLTVQRFGRTMQLYAPLYVSNECVESCTYCSFARENPIVRRTLTVDEVVAEAKLLLDEGFRHLLLVSGEHPRHVSVEYLSTVIEALRDVAPSLSVEVQPQTTEAYRRWTDSGAEGLVVYQETYDRETYAVVHPAGKKKNFDWRLETPERGADGGMKRLGVGALFGLSEWRREAICVAAHAQYLMKRYWKTFVTVSFPRLRPAEYADATAKHPLHDAELARMTCAFRLFLRDVGIVLSTREAPAFRDGMVQLGVTQMSAGSRTEPGGYSAPDKTGGQFHVEDSREPREIARVLRERGMDPVWKDWEAALNR